MNHGDYVSSQRRKAAATAGKVLASELDIIEGSRLLSSLRSEVDVPDGDPDVETFVSIDSETDSLPVGEVRGSWSQSALDSLEPQLGKARSWAVAIAEEALRNVVSRLSV